MIVIEIGSPAWREIQKAQHPSVTKVSIDERADGVAIKINEHMWSPTLSCAAAPAKFKVVTMNMPDGSVEGHIAGCADLTRRRHRFAEPSQAQWPDEVSSKREAREIYNADFDEETDGWYDIRWLPCAASVPE